MFVFRMGDKPNFLQVWERRRTNCRRQGSVGDGNANAASLANIEHLTASLANIENPTASLANIENLTASLANIENPTAS
jgi:hypothetical protein